MLAAALRDMQLPRETLVTCGEWLCGTTAVPFPRRIYFAEGENTRHSGGAWLFNHPRNIYNAVVGKGTINVYLGVLLDVLLKVRLPTNSISSYRKIRVGTVNVVFVGVAHPTQKHRARASPRRREEAGGANPINRRCTFGIRC